MASPASETAYHRSRSYFLSHPVRFALKSIQTPASFLLHWTQLPSPLQSEAVARVAKTIARKGSMKAPLKIKDSGAVHVAFNTG